MAVATINKVISSDIFSITCFLSNKGYEFAPILLTAPLPLIVSGAGKQLTKHLASLCLD